LAVAGGISFAVDAVARQAWHSIKASNPVVINNVRIFNGVYDQLRVANISVADRKIKQLSSGPITAPAASTVIDRGGSVLILRHY